MKLRWVGHPQMDALVDTWGVYPPVTALEWVRYRGRSWWSVCRLDHREAFGPVTRFAIERGVRNTPWKRAKVIR